MQRQRQSVRERTNTRPAMAAERRPSYIYHQRKRGRRVLKTTRRARWWRCLADEAITYRSLEATARLRGED